MRNAGLIGIPNQTFLLPILEIKMYHTLFLLKIAVYSLSKPLERLKIIDSGASYQNSQKLSFKISPNRFSKRLHLTARNRAKSQSVMCVYFGFVGSR